MITLLPPNRWLAALAFVLCMAWLAPAWAVLPIERWTSASGARVLFVKADAIPMLDIVVDVDAGGWLVPQGRQGLASLTASMLDAGNADMDEAAIAEAFARIGALRGSGASDDRASVSLRTLTSEPELTRAVELTAKLLARPSFPEAVLEREKSRLVTQLRESQTRPETIVSREFSAALYGEHPYGRHATPETVQAITRDDLISFHRRHYGASRAVVAMIGNISAEQARAIAETLTRGLPPGEAAPQRPPLPATEKGVSTRIEHPASQSHIRIGLAAIARGHPDFFALQVGNYVLGGGGFVSRLYNEVREKRGLAYSVYSYFSPMAQPGPFTIGLQTRKEQTELALQVVNETLQRFLTEGPTEAEVIAAKANLVGGFPLRIDSNRKILDQLVLIGVHDLPLDWLERWPQRIESVSTADVREAFARHVKPQALSTVVVGAPTVAARP
jgi:zinc protease